MNPFAPDTLRADYKADYVLMTAEAYRTEQDPGLAARRLAVFGSKSPSAIAADGQRLAAMARQAAEPWDAQRAMGDRLLPVWSAHIESSRAHMESAVAELAQRFGGQAIALTDLSQRLGEFDISSLRSAGSGSRAT